MLKLQRVSRWILDENGLTVRGRDNKPVRDDFLDGFDDEIVRLFLYMLANRNWTGNRFEADLIGTPLFFRRVKNKCANGWTQEAGTWGTGTEIGRRDGSWKILICGMDCNRISADRAQKALDVGWRNLSSAHDEYDLVSSTDVMGYHRGLACLPDATVIQGDRDIFTKDMMIMRLYSTER